MSKSIEFRVPVRDGTNEARRGRVAWFRIGDREIKFVLQEGGFLTHYASGYKFGSLGDMRTELMCRFSPMHRFSEHEVARQLIVKAIARRGVDDVLRILDTAPVINA